MDFYNYTDPSQIPDWFWDLIGKARGSKTRFVQLIEHMPQIELYRIEAVYGGAADLIRQDRFHLHRTDHSDDAIDDIVDCAVGNGHEYFEDIWFGRKLLADYSADEGLLMSGLYDVYQERFGDYSPDRETPEPL